MQVFCFVLGVILGAILIKLYSRPAPPPPHPCLIFHEFIPIDVRLIQHESGPMTLKLNLCARCGNHQVHFLPGSWPIETLLQKECALTTLERIARI